MRRKRVRTVSGPEDSLLANPGRGGMRTPPRIEERWWTPSWRQVEEGPRGIWIMAVSERGKPGQQLSDLVPQSLRIALQSRFGELTNRSRRSSSIISLLPSTSRDSRQSGFCTTSQNDLSRGHRFTPWCPHEGPRQLLSSSSPHMALRSRVEN